jgi:hypothetical protein
MTILDLNDYAGILKGEIGRHPSDSIAVAIVAAEAAGASGREGSCCGTGFSGVSTISCRATA